MTTFLCCSYLLIAIMGRSLSFGGTENAGAGSVACAFGGRRPRGTLSTIRRAHTRESDLPLRRDKPVLP